ncbi:MAG TPA: hypothetical protein VHY35_06320 [Stellaceae bacterium]|jgi:hypothetical protein|nr:hypothetical protein [Stellaceae bacterium]
MPPLKLNEEIAAEIKARIKQLDFKAVEKIGKAADKNGTFDVIISTEVTDRAGEIVRQNGWELTNYKNNPIVLWGHDYYSLPIGVCTETYLTEYNGVPALGAKGVFYPSDINPLAQQVRKMYEFGLKSGFHVGCTTSVGFIPREFEPDNRSIITRAELLEFSFVPVPANQGVGPAEGRALTFEEAKELGLDMAELRVKGLEFVEPEITAETKAVGDECTTEDGKPGVLDAALVCQPTVEKSVEETKPLKKKLLQSIDEEQTRHVGEIEKAIDVFADATPSDTEGTDEEKAKKTADATREAMKDLRDAVRDEHDMHRAKSIASLRDFGDAENTTFDKKPHLKAVRDAHDEYEARNTKLLDEFEEKSIKTPAEREEHIDWLAEKMEESQRAHKKAVIKSAKVMCKAAFGEEEQADEKVLEILKTFLAPYVPEQMQTAVFMKVGARISAASKEKLGEAHQHMKAATAIVEALHGALENDDGEESRSVGDAVSPAPAPRKQRSRSSEDIHQNDELNAHLLAKDILRGITTAAQEGLKTLKQANR